MKIDEINDSIKRTGAQWVASENTMTALSDAEKKLRLGVQFPDGYRPKPSTSRGLSFLASLPQSIDWRNNNGNFVTPVQDQGGCGSCVGFGCVASFESRLCIETGVLTKLSEADAFFCSSHGPNCHGWWPLSLYNADETRGICTDVLFPYSNAFIPSPGAHCYINPNRASGTYYYSAINDSIGNAETLSYLANNGPITACFDVYQDFFGYKSGVYVHVDGAYAGGHCICIVGYCIDNSVSGGGYYICKNSWGTGWGNQGYFEIAFGQCNIDTYEKYGVSKTSGPHA